MDRFDKMSRAELIDAWIEKTGDDCTEGKNKRGLSLKTLPKSVIKVQRK